MRMDTRERRRGEIAQSFWASMAVILLLGSAAAWWYFTGKPTLQPDQGQAVVEEFFKQLRTGKTDQAWSATAADFKSFLGQEAFRAYVRKHPELKQTLEFQSYTPAGTTPFAEYLYQATSGSAKNKTPRPVKVRLVREADQWKVESLGIQ